MEEATARAATTDVTETSLKEQIIKSSNWPVDVAASESSPFHTLRGRVHSNAARLELVLPRQGCASTTAAKLLFDVFRCVVQPLVYTDQTRQRTTKPRAVRAARLRSSSREACAFCWPHILRSCCSVCLLFEVVSIAVVRATRWLSAPRGMITC